MSFFSKKQIDTPRRRHDGRTNQAERAHDSDLGARYAFRRNRTLTGSASSKVLSTGESTAQLKSARVQAHDLVRRRRHIGGILLMVIIGASLLFTLVYQFTATAIVRTSDVSQPIDSTYAAVIDDYFGKRPIERLRFLLNKETMTAYVQSVAPEIAAMRVDGAKGFGASLFIVEMRKPIAGWSINGAQQYVDATGVSFTRNYYQTPQVQIVDNSGIQMQAGQAVVSDHFLSFVGRVVGLATDKQYTVTEVVIPQGTTKQIELHIEQVAYPIKLLIDRPAGEQVEDMSRAIGWLQRNGKVAEYVDVRVSGRAFYR